MKYGSPLRNIACYSKAFFGFKNGSFALELNPQLGLPPISVYSQVALALNLHASLAGQFSCCRKDTFSASPILGEDKR